MKKITNFKLRVTSYKLQVMLAAFVLFAFCFLPCSAFAQGGTTGPLTWNLNGGTLTISVTDGGTGAMPDYADWYDPDSAPWQEYQASIHTAIIESGVTSIGNYAFSMCTILYSVIIPNSVTTIREGAFCYCFNLPSVTIPNSITTIGSWAFCYTNLNSITIPNSVITIGFAAFDQCSNLTSITIASSVTTIEDYAFNECTSLISVTNLNLVPIEISSNVFFGVNQNACTLTVPTSAVSSYQNTGVWQEFNIVGGGFLVNPVSSNNEQGYVTGNGLYDGGKSTATLTAVAYTGYKFVKWEINGEVASTANPYIFTVTEDVKLVANFEAETYLVTINVNNDEYGTVTGAGMYEYNTTATITATANNGYKFVNWTIDDVEISTDNPYSFTVTEDVELVAHFEESVGVDELQVTSYELRVYPNPTTGELRVTSYELQVTSIEVFDIYGRKCHLSPVTCHENINISHLPAGIYFVKIRTEAGEVVRKVVKE